jgi:predicted nucleic acid-binding protein
VADDPKDDKYVAAALGGRAGWVVTLDRRHMLALGAYESVRFVTPGDFLAVLRLSTS